MLRIPNRVVQDCANKPTAAQNYELPAGAVAGFRTAASKLADAEYCCILAFEHDGAGVPTGAWEAHLCSFDDQATDLLVKELFLDSSSGSAIDWSAAGENAYPRLSLYVPGEGLLPLGWGYVSTTVISAATTYMTWTGLVAGWDYRVLGHIYSRSGSNTGYPYRAEFGHGAGPTWINASYAGGRYHFAASGASSQAASGNTIMDLTAPSDGVGDDMHFDARLIGMGTTVGAAMFAKSIIRGETTYAGGGGHSAYCMRAAVAGNIEAFRIGYGNAPATNQMTSALAVLLRRPVQFGEVPL